MLDRIDKVMVSNPLVPERDKLARERRIYPSEVILLTPISILMLITGSREVDDLSIKVERGCEMACLGR